MEGHAHADAVQGYLAHKTPPPPRTTIGAYTEVVEKLFQGLNQIVGRAERARTRGFGSARRSAATSSAPDAAARAKVNEKFAMC